MSTQQEKAMALQKRLTAFANGVVKLVSELPQTPQARHIASQALRSGTAAAANYAEARGAESFPDFVHKLRVVLKELNETEVWLDLVAGNSWISEEKTTAIVAENRELCCIIAKSIKTAGGFRR